MKIFLVTVIFIGSFIASEAQVDPLHAQYMMNPLLINPAYAGLNNNLSAGVSYRKQWTGMEGSPSTFNLNAHTSLTDNKMGLGLIVLNDQLGANSNTEAHATYAYRLPLQNKFLSFGLQAGVLNFKNDNSKLNPYDVSDPTFSGTHAITKPSIGAGLILHSDRYFIGLSVPRFLKIENNEGEYYRQHYYATAAYIIYFNEHIRLKPSVLVKGVKGSPLSADINVAATINENYAAGIFTRNFGTYGLLLQMKFGKGYRFGYVFEVPGNRSVGAQFTSHEASVGVNLSVFSFHRSSITSF